MDFSHERFIITTDLLFFILEHDAQVHSGIIQKLIADFQCNQHRDYLKLILRNP